MAHGAGCCRWRRRSASVRFFYLYSLRRAQAALTSFRGAALLFLQKPDSRMMVLFFTV